MNELTNGKRKRMRLSLKTLSLWFQGNKVISEKKKVQPICDVTGICGVIPSF